MGILDWFKNRPGQYDPDRASAELIQWAVDKAVTLINPRLKLVSNYQKRLQPALEITIAFLRVQLSTLPVIHHLSPNSWASDNALRAFFVAAIDDRMSSSRGAYRKRMANAGDRRCPA